MAESRAKNSSPVRLPELNVGQSNQMAEAEQRKTLKICRCGSFSKKIEMMRLNLSPKSVKGPQVA